MRCNNCGWDNPSNAQRCEKCNAPMQGSMVKPSSDENRDRDSGIPLDKTIKGEIPLIPFIDSPGEFQGNDNVKKNTDCPFCGYPNLNNSIKCIQCKKIFDDKEADKINNIQAEESFNQKIFLKTQTPWDQKAKVKFKLKELNVDNSIKKSLEFLGENIILNRSNTINDNSTITSKEQALIEFKDGKWFIHDKSSLKTTFIRPSSPFEIKKGDIILLGDSRFEFDI
ncbi:MAG: FHA domain-containing protein [Bacteroidales bacterium]